MARLVEFKRVACLNNVLHNSDDDSGWDNDQDDWIGSAGDLICLIDDLEF